MKPAEEILLKDALKSLKLSTILRELPECVRQSKVGGDSYEQFLLALCEREQQQRRANQLTRRFKEACFPQMKVLEETKTEKWLP
jgi:hypothetical protein